MNNESESRRTWPFAAVLEYLVEDWLLVSSLVAVLATSLLLARWPTVDPGDFEVLWILAVLLVVLKGLETSGLIRDLAWRLERGSLVPLKLVLLTFFLSMIVTNDVALLSLVPLTLAMRVGRKGLLVIMEALAANAGSALTPVGNPQNLFIFVHYRPDLYEFVSEIAPFSGSFVVMLGLGGLLLGSPPLLSGASLTAAGVHRSATLHVGLLMLVVLAILGFLPLATTLAVPAAALLFDRASLRIDYRLLLVFVSFFALSDNLQGMFGAFLQHPHHVFLLTAVASQLISNVPATLLFSAYTDNWPALLWGASVGGFGSLVGSLANLIAFRLYARQGNVRDLKSFTLLFLALGTMAFLLGIVLYRLFGE